MKIEKQEIVDEVFQVTLTGNELLVVTKALGQSNDHRNFGNYDVYSQLSAACRRFKLPGSEGI